MKKNESGFTLIELMIVVAIIGILASISISAYQNYTIRAQLSEGLTMAGQAKSAISEYYSQHGDWPNDNADAGLVNELVIQGKYVSHVKVTDNEIEIMFDNDSHGSIQGKTITLTAFHNDGSIGWTCSSEGQIPPSQLPASCRTAVAAGGDAGDGDGAGDGGGDGGAGDGGDDGGGKAKDKDKD